MKTRKQLDKLSKKQVLDYVFDVLVPAYEQLEANAQACNSALASAVSRANHHAQGAEEQHQINDGYRREMDLTRLQLSEAVAYSFAYRDALLITQGHVPHSPLGHHRLSPAMLEEVGGPLRPTTKEG